MSCCEVPGANCSREAMFRLRLRSVLMAIGCQYPALFPTVDAWRYTVVSPFIDACGNEGFPDQDKQVWVRLGEEIPAFVFDKEEKFYQADVGLIRMIVKWVLLPDGYDIRIDDHIVINGFAYIVVEVLSVMGVTKLKVDLAKSRFQAPARDVPTYRQFEFKAAIA